MRAIILLISVEKNQQYSLFSPNRESAILLTNKSFDFNPDLNQWLKCHYHRILNSGHSLLH